MQVDIPYMDGMGESWTDWLRWLDLSRTGFLSDEQGVSFITETKRKVFRFHDTILRRWYWILRMYVFHGFTV